MTHEEFESFQTRYSEILQCDEPIRTERLATLMSDLEQSYSIPTLYNPTYEKLNPDVMQFYREVSAARNFSLDDRAVATRRDYF